AFDPTAPLETACSGVGEQCGQVSSSRADLNLVLRHEDVGPHVGLTELINAWKFDALAELKKQLQSSGTALRNTLVAEMRSDFEAVVREHRTEWSMRTQIERQRQMIEDVRAQSLGMISGLKSSLPNASANGFV